MMLETPMVEMTPPRAPAVATIIRVLIVFDTLALLFAAALHVAGARIPLGSAVFVEPQIVPAAIVEGLAGMLFAMTIYAVFTNTRWAWPAAIFAHIFAIAGFLLGIWATRAGTSPFNANYHRVMLVVFVAGLALLLIPGGRAALGRNKRLVR